MAENLYDTSELIELRRRDIDPDGYTTILNLVEFPKAAEFARLIVLYPTNQDCDTALVWSAELLTRGHPVPAVDLVISAICVRLSLRLVTRDSHFKAIKSIIGDLKVQVKR